MDYKQTVQGLDLLYRELLEVIRKISEWGETPPIERHEMIEYEMLIDEHNAIVDDIQETEEYLYQGGAN
jgi:hypothetical protein